MELEGAYKAIKCNTLLSGGIEIKVYLTAHVNQSISDSTWSNQAKS